MALLSPEDHNLTIKAIEYYMESLDSEADCEEIVKYHALLNWVKISHQKF